MLDGMEIKSATFVDKYFPLHFHQSWSLAYIESGSENISFNSFDFLLNTSAWILIPPYSLHKNWGNKRQAWAYQAFYINDDIVKKIAQKYHFDYSQLASTPYFITYCTEKIPITADSIFELLGNLFSNTHYHEASLKHTSTHHPCYIDELIAYLQYNFNDSITLDSLETRFKVNKFKLLKNFKVKIGLTPLEYQTAFRIEKAKQLFFDDISLTHIALESGFYDQSHFTHCFKKYVGVTPGRYKINCNILQDRPLIDP